MLHQIKIKDIRINIIAIISVIVFMSIFLSSFKVQSQSIIEEIPALPQRLLIPKISVDTKVQHIGINAKGAMAVPSNFKEVGWYKYGAIPGQEGTAIIDGHVDNALGLKAIFTNLSQLVEGDEIQILTEEGEVIKFKVTNTEVYNYDDTKASEALFSTTENTSILKLITCEGSWIRIKKTYDKRLIVTAMRIM